MKSAYFLIPGDPDTRTGGYLYDRRIMHGLAALGWRIELRQLDASFPQPTPAALHEADTVLAALPEQSLTVIDGLALGAMPTLAAAWQDRLRLVALVHHPLALETGLDAESSQRLYASEREALRHVQCIIVTSPSTARALAADYEVASERCIVIPPGTDPAPGDRFRWQGIADPLRSLAHPAQGTRGTIASTGTAQTPRLATTLRR